MCTVPNDEGLFNSYISVSRELGQQPYSIQAGGGNTSIKIGEKLFVKASGCCLKDMSSSIGYVAIPLNKLRSIFEHSDRGINSEAQTSAAVCRLAAPPSAAAPARPSVEAGFHAFLGTAVLHSHAAQINLFTCTAGGMSDAANMLEAAGIPCICFPFTDPGAELAFAIIDAKKAAGTAFPQVLLLKNHGLIVWADTPERALSLHARVLRTITEGFSLPRYPVPLLKKCADGWLSDDGLIGAMTKNGLLNNERLSTNLLYPDQLVYLNARLGMPDGLEFRKDTVLYSGSYNTAMALEESLLACAYILNTADKLGLSIDEMPQSGVSFIKGWDAEKYRSKMLH